jgi:hypothetical protein
MTFAPAHFTAVLLFATCASVVFGITQRSSPRAMVRYGVGSWVLFVSITIAASWLMFFLRR